MELDITVQRFILIFFRIFSILWLLPIFTSRAISIPFKAGLGLVLSYLALEFAGVSQDIRYDTHILFVLVLKEVFIGLAISFVIRLFFMMVYAASELAAFQTGFSFARFMDPLTMTQISVLEQFKNILSIMVFFSMDCHHSIIKGIFLSFKELPPNSLVLNSSFFNYLITATGKIFSVGLKISAPVTVTLFIVELSLGLLSRLIPQINVFIEGIPVKILIAMVVLSFSLGITVMAIAGIFIGIESELTKVIRLLV